MIHTIHIYNFITIEKLSLTLKPGFNVITGETGAGKSILIDALSIALGRRAPQNIVRTDADKCEICIDVDIESECIRTWLLDQDIEPDNLCQVRRIITKEGKSRCYINGRQVPLYTLRAFGDKLIKIHSQHQYITLMNNESQLTLLDNFIHQPKTLDTLKKAYHAYQAAQKKLDVLHTQLSEHRTQLSLLEYQLTELNALDLKENEWDKIHTEHKLLSQSKSIEYTASQALQLLDNTEDNGLIYQIHTLLKMLNSQNSEHYFKNTCELLDNAVTFLSEAKTDITQQLSTLQTSEETLARLDVRISEYFDMARKHHIQPEQLYDHFCDLKQQLSNIQGHHDNIDMLTEQCACLKEAFLTLAKQMHQIREKAAPKLAKAVNTHVHALKMPHAKLSIDIQSDINSTTTRGIDAVSFLVRTNLGDALKPLKDIASGGELSRISLALEVTTSEKYLIPCLVFDEVDVGISGDTALKVAQMLQKLGEHRQILCITHQAQVAALGAHHLYVHKSTQDNATNTEINYLSKAQRKREIARMLSGEGAEQHALKHAEALLAGD